MTDTRPDLAAIKARADAATPGPWTAATAPHPDSTETKSEYLTNALCDAGPLWVVWAPNDSGDQYDYLLPVVTGDGPTSEANAEFVAHARADVLALLDALTDARSHAADLASRFDRERADALRERDEYREAQAEAARQVLALVGRELPDDATDWGVELDEAFAALAALTPDDES